MRNFIIIALLLILTANYFVSPLFAQVDRENDIGEKGGLVPCGTAETEPCKFSDFYLMIKNIIRFGLFYFAIPIATLSFAGAGLMLMTSGDNESKRTTAKNMIWWALIGLVLAFAAWLIVDAILDALVKEEVRSTLPVNN